MTLSVETYSYVGSPELGSPGSPLSSSQRSSQVKLYKSHNGRKRSLNGANSATSPTISPSSFTTAFPSFDPTYEQSTTYMAANPSAEAMPLFSRRSEDQGGAHGTPFGKKIKPLVRNSSGKEKDRMHIDLNMSKAENEERGAYVSNTPTSPLSKVSNSRVALGGHSRTISGTSSNSAQSSHRITYVHPARQVPHSPTPPIPTSTPYVPPQDSRPSSSHSNLANIPSLPPPGLRSAPGGGVLRSNTSTPTCMTSPALPPTPGVPSTALFSTSVPTTGRSSMDSSFRERFAAGITARHRSRTNSNAPMDPEEEHRAVAALRADFNAREAAKDEKYRRREEKRDRRRSEAEERKARRRRGNSGATACSAGSGIAASSMSGGSDLVAAATTATASTRKNRSGSGKKAISSLRDGEREGRKSVDQLEGIRYDTTAENRRPTMAREADEEMDEKQQDIPKRGKRQGLSSAGKATQSAWMTFWFRVKTALMKMMAKRK